MKIILVFLVCCDVVQVCFCLKTCSGKVLSCSLSITSLSSFHFACWFYNFDLVCFALRWHVGAYSCCLSARRLWDHLLALSLFEWKFAYFSNAFVSFLQILWFPPTSQLFVSLCPCDDLMTCLGWRYSTFCTVTSFLQPTKERQLKKTGEG